MTITAICLNCGETKILPSNIIVNNSFCDCNKNRQRVLLIRDNDSEFENTKQFVANKATKDTPTSKRRKLPYQFVELLEEAEAKKDNLLEKD